MFLFQTFAVFFPTFSYMTLFCVFGFFYFTGTLGKRKKNLRLNIGESQPVIFRVLNSCFNVAFTLELFLRLLVDQWFFFNCKMLGLVKIIKVIWVGFFLPFPLGKRVTEIIQVWNLQQGMLHCGALNRSLKIKLWGPYKWPNKWVTGFITPVTTLLTTARGPPAGNVIEHW